MSTVSTVRSPAAPALDRRKERVSSDREQKWMSRDIPEDPTGKLVGLETEFMLLDDHGHIANRAPEIVRHRENTGNIVPEFCNAVVEANPSPSSRIGDVEANLLAELKVVGSIADSLGIGVAPLSETGPDDAAEPTPGNRRYALFDEAMGTAHCDIERSLCATHLHLDHKENLVGEYNLLQSMDPVFVLMSSSSFVRGRNSFNCGRVNLFRNELFQDAPFISQLQAYISSAAELDHLQRATTDFFLSRLAPTTENRQLFRGDNNGSAPIRKTSRTIEIRCADANVPSLAVAMAALYKGVLEQVLGPRELEIRIAQRRATWHITSSEILLPSLETLRLMEREGVARGPRARAVKRYLSYLVEIAEGGLPDDEIGYLRPFKEILRHERNVAQVILERAQQIDPTIRETISSSAAAQVNLFMAEQYRDDINGGSQLIDMIRFGVN